MKQVSLEELLEAGCHFGHQVTRQNPKARDFIFEARDNIHIIDLAKTKEGLDQAAEFVKSLAQKEGSTIVIVGTKRQASEILKEQIKKVTDGKAEGIYFVTSKWVGGLLTNFSEVSKNFKKLRDIEALLKNDEENAKYTKKELGLFDKERQKLEGFYGGVADMQKGPDALFIIDTHMENLAVLEASKTGVATVGMVDTNADPFVIDYPIPANDDAVGSIKLITEHIIDAWIEGKNSAKQNPEEVSKDEKVSKKESEKKTTEEKGEGAKVAKKRGRPKKSS